MTRRFLNLFRRSTDTSSQTNREPPKAFAEKPYVLLYRNQFGCLIVAPGFDEYASLDDAAAAAAKLNDELRTPVYVMQTVVVEGKYR